MAKYSKNILSMLFLIQQVFFFFFKQKIGAWSPKKIPLKEHHKSHVSMDYMF